MNSTENREQQLLPQVREFTRLDGTCSLPARLQAESADNRVVRAAERWLNEFAAAHVADGAPSCTLTIAEEAGTLPHRDGYRIRVEREGIRILGGSAVGCFHGLQTLSQVARGAAEIPCGEIVDWPDFSMRGLLHDVTRGKVPTLNTLKLLANRLASLKINQLQLYIEHAFVFDFDPEIADELHGLTPDEIRELDTYCRERFIDLVPAVATLGHMGRILSLPQYRHLAEIEPESSWEEKSWPQRARGLTLDVLNSESHRLIERIWGEILDAFSSPVVNICGDEPWDLGKGRNRDRIPSEKIGDAYIDHILRTHDICARRGRRTQVWSDVVTKHPQLFHRLSRDLTILHWGYDDKADYEGTRRFVEDGLGTVCCPGTSGWKRVLNAMNLAERNISTFARAGKEHGASGILNTDWGDHGHFNALACSWHAIALGAACAWRADHPIGDDFDRRFARWLIPNTESSPSPSWIESLRQASNIAERCETWRLLWQPIEQIKNNSTLPALEDADQAANSARRAADLLRHTDSTAFVDPMARNELIVACEFTDLFADKVRLVRGEKPTIRTPAPEDSTDRMWIDFLMDDLKVKREKFADCWSFRNKPSGLMDIRRALANVCDDVRITALE